MYIKKLFQTNNAQETYSMNMSRDIFNEMGYIRSRALD